jgi:hypothetical protein
MSCTTGRRDNAAERSIMRRKDRSGDPLFFDYRHNLTEPNINGWTGGNWRNRAPNFRALMELFTPD